MLLSLLTVATLLAVFGLGYLMFWLSCRLKAQPCPRCKSQWRTELLGEWDGTEDWRCHACGHAWGHPYGSKM